MSIFPKRSVPGGTVTIHWNFNTAHLTDVHVCPWVRIGVIDPDGKLTMLFEGHVLGLPDPPVAQDGSEESHPPLKYLNKNLPLMILAEYLEGNAKREVLVKILQNIQSGRHYYFTFPVPKDAPLGKYTLLSEVHSGGEVRYSKTAEDDYFFIEQVTCEPGESSQFVVTNQSPEPTPVKVVHCHPQPEGKMKTELEVFMMQGNESRTLAQKGGDSFLLYNEEREVVPLAKPDSPYLLRNQQVLELHKPDGPSFLLPKGEEEGYTLTPAAAQLWQKADGLLNQTKLDPEELDVYQTMKDLGLFSELNW
ncbi:MAG: hypothetical protein AAFQ98_13640 [Bacteroidota bacterium]